MKKAGASFMVILFFLVLLVSSCERSGTEYLKEGGNAPLFELPDLDGRPVNLAELKGKAVFIEFWATWCPTCVDSVPELNELNTYLEGKEGILLTICLDEGTHAKENLTGFVSRYRITYPVLAGNEQVSRKYGVTSIPVLFLFDREHRFVRKYFGPTPAEELIHDMEELL